VKQYGFLATSFTDILDVGPLTEQSYRYTHYPPLSEIIYGTLGKYLHISAIGTYRLFAIGFSAMAMWFLFRYVRRIYGEATGLLATALWSGNLLWMMYADCVHQAPVVQLGTFLGLWGLSRALETRQRRHDIAAFAGAFICFLSSYDGWIFFPAAVLFTIYVRAGNPLSRPYRRFTAICAAGCILAIVAKSTFVIGAVGWHEFVADLHFQFLERASSTYERRFDSATPTLVRRFTMVFSPLFWVTAAYHGIAAVRARSWRAALEQNCAWLLVCALAFLWVFSQLAASQLLASQVVLPFYAIGTARLVEHLIGMPSRAARTAGYAYLVIAMVWSAVFVITLDRAVLPQRDVDAANRYLAEHDHNDYILSNLMAAGPIQAYFEKHMWAAPEADNASEVYDARRFALATFAQTGKDLAHVLVFKQPESRLIDKSLWPLALPLRRWSLTGAPFLWKAKAKQLIQALDRRVATGLAAIGAVKVMELLTFDIYRIDKTVVVAKIAEDLPLTGFLDMTGESSNPNKLLGWSNADPELRSVAIQGHSRCSVPDGTGCKTRLTNIGLLVSSLEKRPSAEVAIRATAACDLTIHIAFARAAAFKVALNGYKLERSTPAATASITVPSSSVVPGINILSIEDPALPMNKRPPPQGIPVRSIEVDACSAAPDREQAR
jgi:hypothetical protein